MEKSKDRDRLKNRSSTASALRRGRFNAAGLQRAKWPGVADKPLISLETAKENVWNFLAKSLEKFGFSLEKFGNPGKGWEKLGRVARPSAHRALRPNA
ncbi:MAG: hypothetical protein WAU78_01975 [Roseiarcus sp.]